MACHLFGARPLPEEMQTYQLHSEKEISVKAATHWSWDKMDDFFLNGWFF